MAKKKEKKDRRTIPILVILPIIAIVIILLYWLVFAQQAPQAPLDSDSDGVADLKDKCPTTKPGVTADEFGCEIISPKKDDADKKNITKIIENDGGDSGNKPKDCSMQILKKEFRGYFGEQFMDSRKEECKKINANGWKETENEVSCYVANLGAIDCNKDYFFKLKIFCENLGATWQCKGERYSCVCKEIEIKENGTEIPKPDDENNETPADEEQLKCGDAPVYAPEDCLKCLDYKCPEGKECYWQADSGKCDCQGKEQCAYHYKNGQEVCGGNCANGICGEYYNNDANRYECGCIINDSSSEPTTCEDSDAGFDIWNKGVCTDGAQNADVCYENLMSKLLEYRCKEGTCRGTLVKCDSYDAFCYDGRCIRRTQDSDADNYTDFDEYEAGTNPADSSSFPQQEPQPLDQCVQSYPLCTGVCSNDGRCVNDGSSCGCTATYSNEDCRLQECSYPGGYMVHDASQCREDESYSNGCCCTDHDSDSPGMIFVTAEAFQGNLGGLSGADAKCQAEAQGAGLGGTWIAILSTSNTNAKDRIPDMVYKVRNGEIIAHGIDMLFGGADTALINGINVLPNGELSQYNHVWSGTDSDGNVRGSQNCLDWTTANSNISGGLGSTHRSNSEWIYFANAVCSAHDSHLYCIRIS